MAAGMAVNAAQSVLTFKAQQAQYAAQMAAWQANVQSAGKSLNDQATQEGVRIQQQDAAASNKKMELQKEALRAQGTALASSEGGGLSEELLLQDIERQRLDYSDIIGYNLKNEMLQSEMNVKGMRAEAESRARSGNPGPAPSFNYAALGVGLAGTALDAYSSFHIKKPRNGDIKTAAKSSSTPFDPGYNGRPNR